LTFDLERDIDGSTHFVLSFDTAEVLIVLHYRSSIVTILRCTNYRAACIAAAELLVWYRQHLVHDSSSTYILPKLTHPATRFVCNYRPTCSV